MRRPDISKGGYVRYLLRSGEKLTRMLAHRMVATEFIGKIPPGMEVNHINGIPSDNRLENLEIVTRSQNQKHALAVLGRHRNVGSAHGYSKLTEKNVKAIRRLLASGIWGSIIAKRFNVSESTISMIRRGRTWKHVPNSPKGN